MWIALEFGILVRYPTLLSRDASQIDTFCPNFVMFIIGGNPQFESGFEGDLTEKMRDSEYHKNFFS